MPGGRVCSPISATMAVPTDGPPPAFKALLYAVSASFWAVPAAAVPNSSEPVKVPGGNPVIEAAGNIPIFPVTCVGPGGVVVGTLATAGVAARIPKPQAVP